jgi:glycosyltransferase involved in cell wall biosynthesis
MYAGIKDLVSEISEEFPFDLIHAHAALPAGYAAMRIAAKFGIPFVVTIHGADLQKTVHINQHAQQAVGEVISHSTTAVFVSHKLKRIAADQFGDDNQYKVIPNGIDPASIKQDSLSHSAPAQAPITLLSVSNLFPSKGIDDNLSALARLTGKYPEVKYLIIGDGPERGYLENLSRELGLSKQVEFLGQIPHDQVMSAMADCDIFSLPSWQEGFGIVYLEAMAHGVPVIGCQGEGIEDFVNHSVTGYLVKPRDLDDLVKVLDHLLDSPGIRTQIGINARKHVLENYTWERNAHRTMQLYREIISDL